VHHVTEHEVIRVGAASSSQLLTAASLDVHPSAMSRLEREGVIRRVIPGVYVGIDHPAHALIEAAAWTMKHPQAVVALLTAAVFHDLTDAFARGTWLYVPFGTSPPRSRVVPVHVVQIAPRLVDPDLDNGNGIVRVEVHGVTVRITNPDRTTLDLWRYPRRISREYALDALRRRVDADGFQMPKFARLGQHLGVWDKIEPVAQGLVMR
jgi:predicted transcriptional regulator of viral defense system